VKKTRFLLFSVLLVLMGALLSACAGGRVVAAGAPAVTVEGDRAYLASGGSVYSLDLATGTEPTTTNAKGEIVPLRFPAQSKNMAFGSAPAAISEDQMVIGNAYSNDRKHLFYSFNPQTMAYGSQPWPFEGPDLWMGNPTVLEGVIYAPNSSGGMYAFDPDGTLLGQFETGGSLWAQPVTDGKDLYVASLDHHIYAVDPADLSQPLWDTELDASLVSAPAVSDGKLYVGSINGSLYALDASTGDVLWKVTLDGGIWGTPALPAAAAEPQAGQPAGTAASAAATPEPSPTPEAPAAGKTLYIGTALESGAGTLYSINTGDGSTVWSVPSSGAIASSPIVHENIVYFVTEDGMIRAVNADKTPAWQQPLGGKFYTAPMVAGDLLLVAPTNNNDVFLAAYTLDGDQKWVFSPNKK